MNDLIIKKTNKKYNEGFINEIVNEWFNNDLDDEDKKIIDGMLNGYEVYKYHEVEKCYFNLTEWNINLYKYNK